MGWATLLVARRRQRRKQAEWRDAKEDHIFSVGISLRRDFSISFRSSVDTVDTFLILYETPLINYNPFHIIEIENVFFKKINFFHCNSFPLASPGGQTHQRMETAASLHELTVQWRKPEK